MKIKELVSELAYDEKGLHQATIGDVRQLVKLLAMKIATCEETKKCFEDYCARHISVSKKSKKNNSKIK